MTASIPAREFLNSFNNNKVWQEYEFVNDSFIHPLDITEIQDCLKGSYGIDNSRDYFAFTKELHISKFLQEISEFFVNTHFRPKKEYFLSNVYIDNEGEESNLSKVDVTVEHAVNTGLPAIIKGERGSGKTATLLVYLYRNYEQLLKKDILWLRCDVHKLYESWITSESAGAVRISLSDYLDLFLAYAFCKYAGNEENEDIYFFMKTLENQPELTFPKTIKASHNHLTQVSLSEEVNDIKERIHNFERSDSKRSYLIDEWVSNAQKKNNEQKRQFQNAKSLADALKVYLQSKQKKLVFFIDGSDNIDINKQIGEKLYEEFLHQLKDFCFKKCPDSISYITLMRPRTHEDLLERITLGAQLKDDQDPFVNTLSPSCCETVTEKRFSYIQDTKLANQTDSFGPISKAIDHTLAAINNETSVIDTLLSVNYNMRDYLHNRLSLINLLSYVSRAEMTLNEDTEEDELRINANSWNKRNKFLNGKLYLNSKNGISTSGHGNIYFNIFYYKSGNGKWYGFIFLRIYQLIKKLHTANLQLFTECITTLFNYDIQEVQSAINICESYGLVHFIQVHDTDDCIKVHLKLNDKFDFFVESTFNDPDILYYLALDTKLPANLLTKKRIKAHYNKVNRKSRYNNVMPFTVMYFLKFIIEQDKHEKVALSDKIAGLLNKYQELNIDESNFILPVHHQHSYIRIYSRIVQVLRNADAETQSQFKSTFGINGKN